MMSNTNPPNKQRYSVLKKYLFLCPILHMSLDYTLLIVPFGSDNAYGKIYAKEKRCIAIP
jgi:hypothetical protein